MRLPSLLIVSIGSAIMISAAAPVRAAEVRLRVVDVGNGLCVVASIPDGHSMLYDAGDKGSHCLNAVRELITNDTIDLVVLSHSDADHIGELPQILGMAANDDGAAVAAAKKARTVLFPGDRHLPETKAIRRELAAIANAKANGAAVWNLSNKPLPNPGLQQPPIFQLGDAAATVVAGWSNGDATKHPGESKLPKPEHNNAVSIVIRLTYGGHSVLLTGDTVGRLLKDKNTACKYAERKMKDLPTEWQIQSEVLIGQHHGGNNASSNCFIRAVMPKFAVFSAGHQGHEHPTQKAANRIWATAQISPDAIFRTDLGDDEGGDEWVHKSIAGCVDKAGDDDVEVTLPDSPTQPVTVRYLKSQVGCKAR